MVEDYDSRLCDLMDVLRKCIGVEHDYAMVSKPNAPSRILKESNVDPELSRKSKSLSLSKRYIAGPPRIKKIEENYCLSKHTSLQESVASDDCEDTVFYSKKLMVYLASQNNEIKLAETTSSTNLFFVVYKGTRLKLRSSNIVNWYWPKKVSRDIKKQIGIQLSDYKHDHQEMVGLIAVYPNGITPVSPSAQGHLDLLRSRNVHIDTEWAKFAVSALRINLNSMPSIARRMLLPIPCRYHRLGQGNIKANIEDIGRLKVAFN